MKANSEIAVVGERCVLVPYRSCHVLQYHEWMQSAEILEATGSEPLSLEEEYEMQTSWREDPTKCTFIVLARDQIQFDFDVEDINSDTSAFRCEDHVHAMVGDVNLFFSEIDTSDDDDVDTKDTTPEQNIMQAELDIMIAESAYRQKGLGREACWLMMRYAMTLETAATATTNDTITSPTKAQDQPIADENNNNDDENSNSKIELSTIRRFFGKINASNAASRALFEKSLGFAECAYAACFDQYEYELQSDTAQEMRECLLQKQSCGRDPLRMNACPLPAPAQQPIT